MHRTLLRVTVASALKPHVSAALLRLGYVYSNVTFTFSGEHIDAASETPFDLEHLRREISYSLYREKIYAETLDMRRSLIGAVTRR
jgi:hypothetical protein